MAVLNERVEGKMTHPYLARGPKSSRRKQRGEIFRPADHKQHRQTHSVAVQSPEVMTIHAHVY